MSAPPTTTHPNSGLRKDHRLLPTITPRSRTYPMPAQFMNIRNLDDYGVPYEELVLNSCFRGEAGGTTG